MRPGMRRLTSTMRWECLAACRSEPQMPQASTFTSTWSVRRLGLGHGVDDDVAAAEDRCLHVLLPLNALRTARRSAGSTSVSNHGLRLIQIALRHDGCGNGKKRGP